MYICLVINMTEPQTQTIGWECSLHCVNEPHVWTRRCEQYIVGTDITVVMVAGDFVFQGWPSTDNTLHRAGKHLQLHDAMMVPRLPKGVRLLQLFPHPAQSIQTSTGWPVLK